MPRRAAPHRGTDVHYGDAGLGAAETAQRTDHPRDYPTDTGAWVDSGPSKTRLKQQSHELQALGNAVSQLSAERFAAIEMPEILRDAITEFRRTRSHEGRRRQMQYVGKLMRHADEEALREAVASATLGSAKDTLMLHETERWRAELIADDEAMTTWLNEYPGTDTQQLRSLVRAARRDTKDLVPEARQPKSHRELFHFIKPFLVAK